MKGTDKKGDRAVLSVRYEYEKALIIGTVIVCHEIVRKMWIFNKKIIKILRNL